MDRTPLFPGESSHLLSPDFAKDDDNLLEFSHRVNENDQLGKIFQVIGTPSTDQDLAFIKDD